MASWTVSRPVLATRLSDGVRLWLINGDRLDDLRQSGPNRVALLYGEWVVLPPLSWSALVPLAPESPSPARSA